MKGTLRTCLLLAEAVETRAGCDCTQDQGRQEHLGGPGALGVLARFLAGYFASRPTHNLVGADRKVSPFLTVKLKQDALVSHSLRAPVSQSVSQLTSP